MHRLCPAFVQVQHGPLGPTHHPIGSRWLRLTAYRHKPATMLSLLVWWLAIFGESTCTRSSDAHCFETQQIRFHPNSARQLTRQKRAQHWRQRTWASARKMKTDFHPKTYPVNGDVAQPA